MALRKLFFVSQTLFLREATPSKHLLISFIQFFCPLRMCPVFTVSDFLFSERANPPGADLPDGTDPLHPVLDKQDNFCEMMFISGTGIAGTLHKATMFHIIFSDLIGQYAWILPLFVISVCVGAD